MLEENGEDKMVRESNNEEVLEHVGGKRTLLNKILPRNANWIGHILKRNCLLQDFIEGKLTEMKGMGRRIIALMI